MSEELLRMMFTLSDKVGSEVTCKVWEAGIPKIYEGILVDIVPFDFINLNRQLIPFVGTNQAIEEIKIRYTELPLYMNHRVEGYEGHAAKDIMGLVNSQNELLGRSVTMEEMQGKANEGKHR